MKKLIVLSILIISATACTNAPAKNNNFVEIPGSVTTVEAGLVGNAVVRVIQHNMEIKPLLQIEILARPNFVVVQAMLIDSIKLKNNTLNFIDGAGAYVESLDFTDNEVIFEFDYIPLRGSSQIYRCQLKVDKDNFGPYTCDEAL